MIKTLIIIGIVGGVGYWAYNKYVKPTVDTVNKTKSIFTF